jgi:hypothetical protein
MGDFHEQRASAKFCFKYRNTFLESFKMLKQASGNEAISRTQTHELYKHFKGGQISIMTTNVQGNHQHKKTMKTSKILESDLFQIVFFYHS